MADFITVPEAVSMCHVAGLKNINDAQIRYKLKHGQILGEEPPQDKPRLGWKVNLKSIEQFIAAHRADVGEAQAEINRLAEEFDKLHDENRSLKERLLFQPDTDAPFSDIERFVREEAEKLKISYGDIIDVVQGHLEELVTQASSNVLQVLLRKLAHLMLADELRQLFADTSDEFEDNPFLEFPVHELIAKWKQLRRFYGRTPTTGLAAVECHQIEEALRHKGVPPLG